MSYLSWADTILECDEEIHGVGVTWPRRAASRIGLQKGPTTFNLETPRHPILSGEPFEGQLLML